LIQCQRCLGLLFDHALGMSPQYSLEMYKLSNISHYSYFL